MTDPKTRARAARRDRRKARQSDFAREGTAKPGVVAHHSSENRRLDWRPIYVVGKVQPRELYPTKRADGAATTNLGALLRKAGVVPE